jgi:predicted secreted protein
MAKGLRSLLQMRRLFSVIFMLIIFGAIGIGCAGIPAAAEYTDPSKAVEVKVGQQFTIVLEGNATTGYQWQSDSDAAYLKQVKSEYKVNNSKPGMVGVPGKQYFTYEAVKMGSTQVKLTYKRSFETANSDQKTFNVTIK